MPEILGVDMATLLGCWFVSWLIVFLEGMVSGEISYRGLFTLHVGLFCIVMVGAL